jgi:hypothetical protein
VNEFRTRKMVASTTGEQICKEINMSEHFSRTVSEFHGRVVPEPLRPSGYAALIDRYHLKVPLPPKLAGIAKRHHPVSTNQWRVLSPRHAPSDDLGGHLEFALKWEGVDLVVLSALFHVVPDKEIATLVKGGPTGTYVRRLWYLQEWLTGRELDVPEPGKVRAVPALDPEQQFGISNGAISTRHKVVENLPGTRAFCPLVRRTEVLERFLAKGLDRQAREIVGRTQADVMLRAAAFLLLNDSRASFRIEGEQPTAQRAELSGAKSRGIGTLTEDLDRRRSVCAFGPADNRWVRRDA